MTLSTMLYEARDSSGASAANRLQKSRGGAPWGKWQPEGFWFPKFWFESRRGSGL